MKNLIMKKEGEASWITWIKKRVDNNLNFLSITTGATGSGKSYSNLTMCKMIDEEFNPREQIAFSFTELMQIINKFNDKESSLGNKKYKVLILILLIVQQ
jgi:Tfp pilus assembly pilus retraction ATPase PilT